MQSPTPGWGCPPARAVPPLISLGWLHSSFGTASRLSWRKLTDGALPVLDYVELWPRPGGRRADVWWRKAARLDQTLALRRRPGAAHTPDVHSWWCGSGWELPAAPPRARQAPPAPRYQCGAVWRGCPPRLSRAHSCPLDTACHRALVTDRRGRGRPPPAPAARRHSNQGSQARGGCPGRPSARPTAERHQGRGTEGAGLSPPCHPSCQRPCRCCRPWYSRREQGGGGPIGGGGDQMIKWRPAVLRLASGFQEAGAGPPRHFRQFAAFVAAPSLRYC